MEHEPRPCIDTSLNTEKWDSHEETFNTTNNQRTVNPDQNTITPHVEWLLEKEVLAGM